MVYFYDPGNRWTGTEPGYPLESRFTFTLGQRATWFNGFKGTAIYLAGTWMPWDRKEAGREKALQLELSCMIDNSSWYFQDEYEFQTQAALAARYYFWNQG
jgi:hypothetical protein